MAVEVKIPSLGESVSQGTIARWLKADGASVQADEILFELETDKATMEIAAQAAGRLEILKPEGSTVEVGTVVARIAEGNGQPAKPAPDTRDAAEARQAAKEGPRAAVAEPQGAAPEAVARIDPPAKSPVTAAVPPSMDPSSANAMPLSPAVRKIVEERALDPAKIAGTGKGGRLTKEDVLRAAEAEPPAAEPAPQAAPAESPEAAPAAPPRPAPAARPTAAAGEVERRPMSGLRKRIAERLVEAQRTAAILTTFNEIDMSGVMALRRTYKERFEKLHGVGLGFMSLFARAVVLALRDVPVVNSQIDGGDVVEFRRVHLGIAVGTKRGLVVPVVRDADSMSIADLERAIGELARAARDGKLVPDQLSGGTFTISNGGVYGSLLSTPILNPPQSGILGMHKIEDRPIAVGGQVVVRPMMYVALSYDHRLVDGEQAVTFLVRVKERVEDPARMLLEV